MNTYDIGDRVTITATFSVATVATDPTTVTARYRLEEGAEIVPAAIVKDSTGVYHYTIDPTESGWYYYRFAGTGAVIAAGEGQFYVRPSLS